MFDGLGSGQDKKFLQSSWNWILILILVLQ